MKEIIDILTTFQKGYEEKIPENASALMTEIFSNRQDLLALGTSSSEVCIGRNEVTELIHDDWDGGWGDFTIDIDGAKIEVDGNVAWFYADGTVKYSFEETDDKCKRYVDFIKEIAEKQDATPKKKLSFLNWALGLHFHQRKQGKREYLWPSELSGMLVRENGNWKIGTLHFSTAKPNYPDERLEGSVRDYQTYHDQMRDKIIAHEGNEVDDGLLDALRSLENELANDAEFGGLSFDLEKTLAFDAGRFIWMMAIGTRSQSISEDQVFEESLQEIKDLDNSDLSPEEVLFVAKRSIAYALKEVASGTEFTLPIRLTAVLEKVYGGYKFRNKHFSYPFFWIFEGKL